MLLKYEIEKLLKSNGMADVGYCRVTDGPEGLPYAVSVAAALSDAVVDEIAAAPTYTYYHHYRTVNALIDRMLLQTGFLLREYGYRYIPIAASQSSPTGEARNTADGIRIKKPPCWRDLEPWVKARCFYTGRSGPAYGSDTVYGLPAE
jgi:hypothetical protein